MMYGTRYRQGDIVLVTVPFTDFSASKQRPALVMSNNAHNARVQDIVICGITSNLRLDDYSVMLDESGMEEGSIYYMSRIQANKIFTVHQAIIRRRLGRTRSSILAQAKQRMTQLIS